MRYSEAFGGENTVIGIADSTDCSSLTSPTPEVNPAKSRVDSPTG